MRIEPLERHRDRVATIAAWHHAEWASIHPGWTLEMARAELESHGDAKQLPTTLLLLDGHRLLGTVSLVLEDAPGLCDHGSPWLANLYVVPEARGVGHGARLVGAAVDAAARQGIEELFLFTPGQADFYRRLGWRLLSHTRLHGTAVDLMDIKPMAVAA